MKLTKTRIYKKLHKTSGAELRVYKKISVWKQQY